MFRLKVIVNSGDGKIAVGEEFDSVCDFFFNLPTQLSNNKDILLLPGRPPVKLFLDERSHNELEGIETSIKDKMNRAKKDVKSYFNTLAHLQER